MEGESVSLADGRVFDLTYITHQDYAGGIDHVTFCIINRATSVPTPFGGCPGGTTASSCADATQVRCTGSPEFGEAIIDCTFSGSIPAGICDSSTSMARCSG